MRGVGYRCLLCVYVQVCVFAWRNTYSHRMVGQLRTQARAHTLTTTNNQNLLHTPRTEYRGGVIIRISNFDILVQFFEILFSFISFHDPEDTGTSSIRNVGSHLPVDMTLKLNKHYGENRTTNILRFTHVNDGLGSSQSSVQRGDLCAYS